MGKVLKARDALTDRLCAIKFLDATRKDSELHEIALKQDLDSLRNLKNPNILALIDDGVDAQLGNFIVTEWLETDLETFCAGKPFQNWPSFWKQVGLPVLSGLSYALTKNRVHRDLKPANLMFDDQGQIRIIDFGISAVIDRLNLGRTLRRETTPVYSPPEGPDAKNLLRDVYGFAATAVYSFSGIELQDRDHLISELERIPIPADIRAILSNSLSADPDERPDTVLHLQNQLSALTSSTEGSLTSRRPTVLVSFPRGVIKKANSTFGLGVSSSSCISQLNKSVFIEKPRVPIPSDKHRVDLVAADFTVSVSRDAMNPAVWVARAFFETRPTRWSWAQERGMESTVEFREASERDRSPMSERAIDGLMDALEDHVTSIVQTNDNIFDVWRAVLRGRSEYYGKRYPNIHVQRFRVDGQRIACQLRDPPDTNIVGLHYFVSDGIDRVTSAVIESIQDDEVILYSDLTFNRLLLTGDGLLQYNSTGTEKAAKHQEAALDRIQNGAAPIPNLANYLGDPSLIPSPSTYEYVPVLDHLDPDKRIAAKGAIGANPIYLVVGPPGTGKTELIAEVVLQELKRQPEARILLSAQTHMAVDNALSRLREIDPNIKCVRLGRSQEKISREIADLQLDRVAPQWRRRVVESCNSAVDAYCSGRGVDADALRARRSAIYAHEAETALALSAAAVTRLKSKISAYRESQGSNDVDRSEIDSLEDALLQVTAQLESAELRSTEAAIALHGSGERAVELFGQLQGGAELVKLNTESEDTGAVLTIIADWVQRLSVSQEFFPAILAEAQVVAGTCLGFIGVPGTEDVQYDLAIVEEASRALPSELLVPGSRAKRIVLVGDGKQLPPFIESALLTSDWLEPNNLSKDEVLETLFSRLETRMPSEAMHRLRMQYRMIEPICKLVENVFYPGALEPATTAGKGSVTLTQLGQSRNVAFVSTSKERDRGEKSENPGYSNACEVRTVRKLLRQLLMSARKKRLKNFSVVVLTPYVAQRTALEQAIAHIRGDYPDIQTSAHTIHTFQGRQADIAIYSAVRSNDAGELGFTDDSRLLNVALSRGRGGLVIVGDATFLAKQNASWSYRDVLTYVTTHPESCLLKDADHV